MSEPCKLGYGDQDYGGSYYGTGEYHGVGPREVVLHNSTPEGEIDLNAPLTYVPTTPVENILGTIPSLTVDGQRLFSNIPKLLRRQVHLSYYKLFILNANPSYALSDVTVDIDATTDPFGWLRLAPTITGSRVPAADERNVGKGDGPGDFITEPVELGNILPGEAVSFWIERRVFVLNTDPYVAKHRLIVKGTTEAEGTHCDFS